MTHDHDHDRDHGGCHVHESHHVHGHHHHGELNYNRAFAIGVGLNLAFVVVEIIFGLFANSLALLADAGHNFSDVLGLLLAWGASVLGNRLPSARRTYGLRRSSILAALLNSLILLMAIGMIAWEAIDRLIHPDVVATGTVMIVAFIGVIINTATALLFMGGKEHDLNIRGVYLHMAADAAISLGVVLGAFMIAITSWVWIDPALSLGIAAAIGIATWRLLRQSLDLSLDAVPDQIDVPAVQSFLGRLPGVVEIHDLHIWAISTTETALTVHIVKPEAIVDDDWLAEISDDLRQQFNIGHATIQIESGVSRVPCKLAPDHVV